MDRGNEFISSVQVSKNNTHLTAADGNSFTLLHLLVVTVPAVTLQMMIIDSHVLCWSYILVPEDQ